MATTGCIIERGLNQLPLLFRETNQLAGDTYSSRWHFQVDMGDGAADVDFTDCTIWLTVKERDGAGDIVLSRELGYDVIDEGKFRVVIAAEDSQEWEGIYISEVEATFPVEHQLFPEGGRKTLLRGTHEYVTDIVVDYDEIIPGS